MSPSPQTDLPTLEQLDKLRSLLADYCGVYLDDTRRQSLRAAVGQRAAARGRTAGAYATSLATPADKAELQCLTELLLNHETIFFRNRPHMLALNTLLPELHRRLPPGEPIRIWSAGCATGEEPYSLAISALETLGDLSPRQVEILGSDLSKQALARASEGVYRGRALANLSATQRAQFFSPRGDGLAVSEQVRRLVRFEQHNLLAPFPVAVQGVHVIFCQNVTIYFQLATCRALMERFYHTLADGGLLFLGFSETLWNIYDRFRWREVAGSYVYYKDSQAGRPPTAPLRDLAGGPQAARPARVAPLPVRAIGPGLATQARSLLDAGNMDAALELLRAVPLAGPEAPDMLALAARAHANRGNLELAAAEAHRALELDPLATEAHLLVGLIYARQGQTAEAIRQLERARYLDAAAPLISFHLAECYRQAERNESALREYRNTVRKLAGYPPDQLLDGVAAGWIAATCRRYIDSLGGE